MNKGKNNKSFPLMETNSLILRQIYVADAKCLHRYWSDPKVTEYFTLDPFKNIQETLAMIHLLNSLRQTNEGIRWAITKKDDKQVVGTCGFHNIKIEHARGEIGYELGIEYWGQGIMAEALTAMIHYGFVNMNLNRIEAFVNLGNTKSLRILEKMGFKCDGLLREYEFARGKFVDQYCYSLLKKEYNLDKTKFDK